MIKTAIAVNISAVEARTVTYLVNGTQLGLLSSGTQNNHIQTSNRPLQCVIAVRAEEPESGSPLAYQRQRISNWQTFIQLLSKRGIGDLNAMLNQYHLESDLLICFDEYRMNAWLPTGAGFYLLRQGELRRLRPIIPREPVIDEEYIENHSYFSLQVSEDDYVLVIPSGLLDYFQGNELAEILQGLQQLPAKLGEILQTARQRGFDQEETYIAIQVLRLEDDQDSVTERAPLGGLFRSWFNKPVAAEDSASPETVLPRGADIDDPVDRQKTRDRSGDDRRMDGYPPEDRPNSASRGSRRSAAYEQAPEQERGPERRFWTDLGPLGQPRWVVALAVVLVAALLFGGFRLARGLFGGRQPTTTTTGNQPSFPGTNRTSGVTGGSQTSPLTGSGTGPSSGNTLVTSAPDATEATTGTTSADVILVVQSNKLNLRESPEDGKVLRVLVNGDKVVRLEEAADGWVKVRTSEGEIGYLSARYVALDQATGTR